MSVSSLLHDSFCLSIRSGDVQGAMKLVTPATANLLDEHGRGFVEHFCYRGVDDDPTILHLLFKNGAVLSLGNEKREHPVFEAARKGKTKILRALLDHGVDVNMLNNVGETILDVSQGWTSCVIWDAGGKNMCRYWVGSAWEVNLRKFENIRAQLRMAAICILGLARANSSVLGPHNGCDVLRMIARCVWSTRAHRSHLC